MLKIHGSLFMSEQTAEQQSTTEQQQLYTSSHPPPHTRVANNNSHTPPRRKNSFGDALYVMDYERAFVSLPPTVVWRGWRSRSALKGFSWLPTSTVLHGTQGMQRMMCVTPFRKQTEATALLWHGRHMLRFNTFSLKFPLLYY